MKIIQHLKKYRKSTDLLLLVFFIGNILVLGDVIFSSFNKDFVVRVVNANGNLTTVNATNYIVEQRQEVGLMKFRSEKLLDFLFVDKVVDCNMFLILFTAFVLFQIMRIKSLWYHQYFTDKLYTRLDTLSYVAAVMFVFSRIQEHYLNNLVTKMTSGKQMADIDSTLLTVSVVILLLGNLLKSFAKQGNRLQKEQDLTI